MQSLDQHEAVAVVTQQDRVLHPVLEDVLGKLLHGGGLERRPPLHWHVDFGDLDRLALHHGPTRSDGVRRLGRALRETQPTSDQRHTGAFSAAVSASSGAAPSHGWSVMSNTTLSGPWNLVS